MNYLGEVSYIFRHLVPEGEGKVRLSGYGVELQIKSSEYKAQEPVINELHIDYYPNVHYYLFAFYSPSYYSAIFIHNFKYP